MTPRAKRRLFIFVLVLLPVQYALVGIIDQYGSEPWPALVLPAFQSTGDRDGSVSTSHVTLKATFDDDSRRRVPMAALLADLPSSQHLGFLRTQCRPASLSGTARTERCRHPEAAAWLRDRLAVLHPDRRPHRLDIVWNQLRYAPAADPDDAGSTVRTTPLDTLTIRW